MTISHSNVGTGPRAMQPSSFRKGSGPNRSKQRSMSKASPFPQLTGGGVNQSQRSPSSSEKDAMQGTRVPGSCGWTGRCFGSRRAIAYSCPCSDFFMSARARRTSGSFEVTIPGISKPSRKVR